MLYEGKEALLVTGNPTNHDIEVKVEIPYKGLGFSSVDEMKIKQLWNGSSAGSHLSDTGVFEFLVPKDRVSRGGLSVWLLK